MADSEIYMILSMGYPEKGVRAGEFNIMKFLDIFLHVKANQNFD